VLFGGLGCHKGDWVAKEIQATASSRKSNNQAILAIEEADTVVRIPTDER
jgi:hypothetical protein